MQEKMKKTKNFLSRCGRIVGAMLFLDVGWNEIAQTLVLFTVALSWTKIIESLVKKEKLSMELSRKSIHIGI